MYELIKSVFARIGANIKSRFLKSQPFRINRKRDEKFTMRKKSISFDLTVYRSIDELPEELGNLLLHAMEALSKSYAPYSDFYVAAAAQMQNGKIVTGANFENASYPLALCAERMVIASAQSQFPGMHIKNMAITARNPANMLKKPIPPCGACRQVLSEVEYKNQRPIRLILGGETGEIYVIESASMLLPFGFDGDFF